MIIISTDINVYEKKAELLKALGHPYRPCIAHGLIKNKCNVSKYKMLENSPNKCILSSYKTKNSWIVKGIREGNEICYEVINKDAIK